MYRPKYSKKACAIWLIFGLILCMTGCNRPHAENGGENALADAQRELESLGIVLTGLVDSAEGESTDGYGYYRFHVCSGRTESLKNTLNGSFCEMSDISMEDIPEYGKHPISQKMHKEKFVSAWCLFASGANGAKTRYAEFYLTEGGGENYLYSFFALDT